MYNVILEASESGAPTWVTLVIGAIVAAVAAFVVPLLRQKAAAARAMAESIRAGTVGEAINTRALLVEQLKAFLLDTAAVLAEKNFPKLAARIQSGDLKADAIKDELKSWGRTLRDQAIQYFETQGIDIIATVGDNYLDQLISWSADRVSPFPGRETAVALLKAHDGKAVEWLLDKGVDWVRGKMSEDTSKVSP